MNPAPVVPLTARFEAALEPILARAEVLPRDHHRRFDRKDLVRCAVTEAARLVERPEVAAWTVATPEGAGVAAWQPLPWDTEMLGVPAGRIPLLAVAAPRGEPRLEIARRLVGEALERIRAADAAYVGVRVDARDIELVQALEEAGFALVDGILRFAREATAGERPPHRPQGVRIREARSADALPLRRIAEAGFVYDRFHNDPIVPAEVADRLHGVWIENGVAGTVGCGVLVAEAAGEPAGFFLLAEDATAARGLGTGIGTLVLISVDSRFRRRGIARALTEASVQHLAGRGNAIAEVGTQVANLPASSVYLAAGFRLVRTSVSLRWWDRRRRPGAGR